MIAVIILNWNRAEETLACIQSVLSLPGSDYEVILVDNGSSEPLPELSARVHVLRNQENLGFAEGNNRGIAYALERGAEYLFLLNNDTLVDQEILNAFKEAAALYPDAGVFGAKIYYYDDPATLWYAGGEVLLDSGRCYHVGCTESDLEKKWEEIKDTGYACGCALFIRAEVVQQVGLMHPQFFLMWEEIDWCFRIRAAGYRCLFVPNARVWHKISASFEGGNRGPLWQYFYSRNRLLFLKRHHPAFFSTAILWREIGSLVFRLCNPRLDKKERSCTRASLAGIFDYYRGRFGAKRS